MISIVFALIFAAGAGGFAAAGHDWFTKRNYAMAAVNLGFTATLTVLSLAVIWEVWP